ncbi:hypothetical protein EVU91_13325 [Macrococcoides bohemicum]|uniref:hypothetical protein n=1 Tax=Macrococcoides bohemicum TaxID=1903056 RepID=UPI00105A1E1B|nr:hypothetical protein [Macrococcus bohemicus]TDL33488.1 hypothetical protein EVU91_13325 [Macrococcus bohemicus]
METREYISINMEKFNKLKPSMYLSLNSNNDLDDVEKQLIKDILENIIDSVKGVVYYSLSDVDTVLQRAISLRYLLETLITTSLLVKEPEYKYIMYVEFYKKQIDTQTNIIKELKNESKKLEDWNKKEYKEKINLREIEKESIDNFHKFLNTEYTIVADFNNLQKFDFIGLQYYIDNKIIPIYQKELCDLEEKQNNILKEFVRNDKFNSLFPGINNQVSKAKKIVKDNKGDNGKPRSWAVKAYEVGLKEEYDFIYSYTSNLSHFAAFSLYSSNTTNKVEEEMMLKRINIYLTKIIANLKIFMSENDLTSSFIEIAEIIEFD